jgi:hypothetical protein
MPPPIIDKEEASGTGAGPDAPCPANPNCRLAVPLGGAAIPDGIKFPLNIQLPVESLRNTSACVCCVVVVPPVELLADKLVVPRGFKMVIAPETPESARLFTVKLAEVPLAGEVADTKNAVGLMVQVAGPTPLPPVG